MKLMSKPEALISDRSRMGVEMVACLVSGKVLLPDFCPVLTDLLTLSFQAPPAPA